MARIAMPFNEGIGSPTDNCGNTVTDGTTGSTWGTDEQGRIYTISTGTITVNYCPSFTRGAVLICYNNLGSIGSADDIVNDELLNLIMRNASTNERIEVGNTATQWADATYTFFDANSHELGFSWEEGGSTYVMNKLLNIVATGTTGATAHGSTFRIFPDALTGDIRHMFVFDGYIPPAMMQSLIQNPWQIYEPQTVWLNLGAVSGNITESIPAGALHLTPGTPNVYITGDITESIPASALTLTSYAPNAYITGNITESIPASTLTLTGFAPNAYILTTNVTEVIPSSLLQLTTFAPLVSITGHVREAIPSTALSLTSYAPLISITGHVRESIPASNLTLTSFAPNVRQQSQAVRISIPAAALHLTAFAPTDYITGHVRESIPAGTLRLVSYAPTVTNTGFVAPAVTRPTGGISKRVKAQSKPRPRIIMVDGKNYIIENPWQEFFILQEYLDKLERQQRIDLQKKKMPAVKRKIKLNIKNITRTQNRIDKVKARIEWIRKEDEEILAILAA